MKKQIMLWFVWLMVPGVYAQSGKPVQGHQTPMMGWASWNHFRVHISEQIIRAQTDALVASGMKAAGYTFINIDDGFYGGRDGNGAIKSHPVRFPAGMGALAAYIHSKGLKAGTYSDAGINTCGSYWDKDSIGVGMGLYGHERQDLELMLKQWGFDFIKVDWCGGEWLGLDEQTRYTEIGRLVHAIKPAALYNVCRWKFPGKWVVNVANSWRVSGDISERFDAIATIIDLNAGLWPYCGPGHVNDMDMLQVGRGMSYEEDKTHFSMWCMLNSPLLAGNDLTKMSKETLGILTNKDMIAINQDPLVYQARRLRDDGDQEVWARPLRHTMSGEIAVALFNRAKEKVEIRFQPDSLGIEAGKGYTMRDVWSKKAYARSTRKEQSFEVPAHGVVVLRIKGTSIPYNVFQYK
ncbi:glycoside hydrolase family 27 protein [Niabella sp. CC-SYL272]|uniref:glycoside hydrolase family 27 protein n=1 Tax=Niabella agricola TaxID=2891571 RepID=UPI001F3AD48F|nr:glycoside hydrolase family 27 protein [Niabella agricola]MCF3112210.1 glycoside hydrolase family 27 protein [Niabella agricola]